MSQNKSLFHSSTVFNTSSIPCTLHTSSLPHQFLSRLFHAKFTRVIAAYNHTGPQHTAVSKIRRQLSFVLWFLSTFLTLARADYTLRTGLIHSPAPQRARRRGRAARLMIPMTFWLFVLAPRPCSARWLSFLWPVNKVGHFTRLACVCDGMRTMCRYCKLERNCGRPCTWDI